MSSYDHWKTTNPADKEWGPEPDIDEPDEPQSFMPEVRAEDEATFVRSGNRFPTYDDALMYLMSLVLQYPWMRTRITPSIDLPNCEWIKGRIKPLKPGDVA